MQNAEIAAVFEEMADLLELKGENAFRVRAYRNGAKTIADLPQPIAEILADEHQDLKDFPGIGATLAEKCEVLVKTGKLPQLESLRASTPPVLIKLTRIPGLGAKKAATLVEALKLTSLDDLKAACEQQLVRGLKGFGAKTEEVILNGLAIAEAASQRLRIDQAEFLVSRLGEHLSVCTSIDRMEFAGSYRRRKETVGDIDILVTSSDASEVMDRLASFPSLSSIIARGDTKMSIRVEDQFQVDLRVVSDESFGAALQYFTGSKEHNVAIRSRARKMGLTVNEYGVARIDSPDELFAGREEAELYAALGLQWIAPELREGRKEVAWAEQGNSFPELLQASDIIADLHMHTHATDGSNSIVEMALAARHRGLHYIAITDHSKRVSMARGLDETRLLAQWEEIDRINANDELGIAILKGIECDILESGPMDIADEVLAQADWVIASVHYGQKQSREQITDRILGALKNPHVDVIAHPTGRLIGKRPPYEVDLQAVFQCAAEQKKFLELNANPHRLDLSDQHLIAAIALGIPISINSDAHSLDGFDVMHYGVEQARRAGLLRSMVVNTWPLEQLLSRIADR